MTTAEAKTAREAAAPPGGRKPAKSGDPLRGHAIWMLWREARRRFPLGRALLGAYGQTPVKHRQASDAVQLLRLSPPGQAVIAHLHTATPADLERLITLAEVNARRQDHFFRSVVLIYITVPLTIGALWAQLSPSTLRTAFANPDLAGLWAGVILGSAGALLVRFLADWHAKAFLGLLEIAKAEGAAQAPSEGE